MPRREFTYSERLKMIMAAFEMCPDCQSEFLRFAEVPGRNAIDFMRDLLWNLWQNWPHGSGCPRPEVREVPATTAPTLANLPETGAAAEAHVAAQVGAAVVSE